MIELGSHVKDRLTGFEGVAVSRTTYLTGCAGIGVQAPYVKGKPLEAIQFFDEPRLEVTKKGEATPPTGSGVG